ncbi:transglutaminase-like cysteine peptidase [Microvirga sp. VF16]|uniref:transglutaminase-like cysteine peptidase n=1 Tax=Microvirga sp. VF16 TaxID=2807101 RepID=UPI001FED7D6F|nr:transglutaminase-like cysteine peptidase [Microvirga sp. VF16]
MMPWTIKRQFSCYPVSEKKTARGGLVWTLRSIVIGLLLLFSLVGIPRVNAGELHPFNAAWIPSVGESAQPTDAWSEFCERSPGDCAIDPSEPATIKLDERAWALIVAINQQVNAAISPQEDIAHWGVIDRWDYPDDGYGDCEDYQLLKRRLLVEAGLPRRALRMVVVLDELGAGHAVMAIRTDRGDFILDNKRDTVLPWHQTGYVYIKSEGDRTHAWVWLGNQATVTSAFSR